MEIYFKSGIDLYEVAKDGAESQVPPAGQPHWGRKVNYPAAYVREGGNGGTKALQVKWKQKGYEGASARLKGTSKVGEIEGGAGREAKHHG